jgi:AraC-like DNA-binding protein
LIELLAVCLDDMNPDWHIEENPTLTDILILIVHGRAIYSLNGETVELNKGDMLFIPQGVLRSGVNAPEGPHQKYSFHYKPYNPGQFPFDSARTYRKVRTRNLDLMKTRFAALEHHWFRRLPHGELISTGIAIELLGYYSRELAEEKIASVKLRLMQEVQDYIRKHYREPIRIEDLSNHINRAPNYITQTFKVVTGMTPISYMHQVRIYAARDLILDSRMTIGEVAEYLGYSDQAYFNRMFKRIMSYPPSYVHREMKR